MLHLLPPLPLDFRLLFEGGRFLALLLRPPLRSEGDRFIADGEAVWKAVYARRRPSRPPDALVETGLEMAAHTPTGALVPLKATRRPRSPARA